MTSGRLFNVSCQAQLVTVKFHSGTSMQTLYHARRYSCWSTPNCNICRQMCVNNALL